MNDEKPILDDLIEKFEKFLPKHLQPHAFKIVFGAIVACILALGGWYYGLNTLLAFIIFCAILYGVIGILIFLIDKIRNKNV